MKELVEQKQHGDGAAGEVYDLAQARDLGIEAGRAALQGIHDPDGGAGLEGREPEAARAHRGARLREHHVDPEGAQQGAFAGHIGAADD